MTFDLDAKAAEAGIVAKTMRFAGQEWPLPAALPMVAFTAMGTLVGSSLGDLSPDDIGLFGEACRALLGEHADEILAKGFGLQHFMLLIEEYGVTLGESPASSTS